MPFYLEGFMNFLLYSSFLNQNRRSFDNSHNQVGLDSTTPIYDICNNRLIAIPVSNVRF